MIVREFYSEKDITRPVRRTAGTAMLAHLRLTHAVALITLIIGVVFAVVIASMLLLGVAPPHTGWASTLTGVLNAVGMLMFRLHRDALIRLDAMRVAEELRALTARINDVHKRDEAILDLIEDLSQRLQRERQIESDQRVNWPRAS
jgi:hypothetical protein